MKTIILFCLVLNASMAFSQNSSNFDYHHFLIDEVAHFQLVIEENTSFGFYSQNDGGELLRKISTADGVNTFTDFDVLPAMVVCLDEQRRKQLYGQVKHTKGPLFHFSNLTLHASVDDIRISWQLEELSDQNIIDEIQKLNEQGNFEFMEEMEIPAGVEKFSFGDKEVFSNATYRIVVKSKTSTAYFVSEYLIYNADEKLWQLYPVPANDFISVDKIPANSTYTIFNLNGEEVKQGVLEKYNDFINVSDFENGVYFIQFTSGKSKLARKFVISR